MQRCSVPGCTSEAAYEVILYDLYLEAGDVFFEEDETCPFICREHMRENEARMEGQREPRGDVRYPYTNQNEASGFTIYRPLNP